jgi:hypothetical protein
MWSILIPRADRIGPLTSVRQSGGVELVTDRPGSAVAVGSREARDVAHGGPTGVEYGGSRCGLWRWRARPVARRWYARSARWRSAGGTAVVADGERETLKDVADPARAECAPMGAGQPRRPPRMMRVDSQAFGDLTAGPWRFTCVNSRWAGHTPGCVDPDELARLDGALRSPGPPHRAVLIHHPPRPPCTNADCQITSSPRRQGARASSSTRWR